MLSGKKFVAKMTIFSIAGFQKLTLLKKNTQFKLTILINKQTSKLHWFYSSCFTGSCI